VQGLWIARLAEVAGLKVALVEARSIGASASGGLLGALMPHMPTGWSEKKQFQFEALVELEDCVHELEDQTGISTGYVRAGRIMPVRSKGFLDQLRVRERASRERWRHELVKFELSHLDATAFADWINPAEAPLGLFWDPLAARIHPPSYLEALRSALGARCDVYENWPFASHDPASGSATRADGAVSITAERVVLAAGYETYAIAERMTGLRLGRGIKGQAVLLSAGLPLERPIIYDDGMYIVAHSRDRCAVGSTTEREWSDPCSTDDAIEARLAAARKVCPPLRTAKVISRWAGVRPQSAARDPIVGRLPTESPIYVATGGFKITFGIAHAVAARLIESITTGQAPNLPATFDPEVHIAAANGRTAGNDQE